MHGVRLESRAEIQTETLPTFASAVHLSANAVKYPGVEAFEMRYRRNKRSVDRRTPH